MKLRHLGVLAALAAAGTSSHAIVNGIDPAAGPVINPVTNQATQLWKLGGTVSGASAVQIAPRWILASHHATPATGATFVNQYGQASIVSCAYPPGEYKVLGPNDLSLCRLAAPIALPAGTLFPALVSVPQPSPQKAAVNHWGYMLAIGYSTGARRVAWSGFDGLPPTFDLYDITLNPSGPEIETRAIIPHTSGGDSGGGVFFFPYDGTTGYLAGVLLAGGPLNGSPNYILPEHTQWIVGALSLQGDTPPAVVPFTQLVPDTASRMPRSMKGSVVSAAVTGPTSARLSWTAPPGIDDDNAPVTRYLARIESSDTPAAIVLARSAAGNLNVNTLVDGKRYQACILSGNSVGYRQSFLFHGFPDGSYNLDRQGCTWFTAGAPNPPQLNTDPQLALNPVTGKVDMGAQWAAPVPNGVTVSTYLVTIRIWAKFSDYGKTPPIRISTVSTGATSFQLPGVLSGKEAACWSVSTLSVTQVRSVPAEGLCFSAGSIDP